MFISTYEIQNYLKANQVIVYCMSWVCLVRRTAIMDRQMTRECVDAGKLFLACNQIESQNIQEIACDTEIP